MFNILCRAYFTQSQSRLWSVSLDNNNISKLNLLINKRNEISSSFSSPCPANSLCCPANNPEVTRSLVKNNSQCYNVFAVNRASTNVNSIFLFNTLINVIAGCVKCCCFSEQYCEDCYFECCFQLKFGWIIHYLSYPNILFSYHFLLTAINNFWALKLSNL